MTSVAFETDVGIAFDANHKIYCIAAPKDIWLSSTMIIVKVVYYVRPPVKSSTTGAQYLANGISQAQFYEERTREYDPRTPLSVQHRDFSTMQNEFIMARSHGNAATNVAIGNQNNSIVTPTPSDNKENKKEKVTKPPNCFILYRKDKQESVKLQNPGIHCSQICKF
jgi:hypothetical protein